MKTSIRKIGNSAGMTIPALMLKSLELDVGDAVDIEFLEDGFVVKKLKTKPQYSLDELLQQCDEKALAPEDMELWGDVGAVGSEIW